MGQQTIDLGIQAGVDQLLRRYAKALDSRHLDGWVECFAEDAAYSVVPRHNHERGLPLGIMTDMSKARIRDRVVFITKVCNGVFTDYIPRHLFSLVEVGRNSGTGEIDAISNFSLYATEATGQSLLLAVGEYHDNIVECGGELKFRSRKVVLDTEILPRSIVYPF